MINKGKRILYDDLDKIKDRHGSYKCELTGNNEIDKLSNLPYVTRVEQDGLKSTLHLEPNISPNEFIEKLPPDIEIKELNITRISLHDIFINTITGGRSK